MVYGESGTIGVAALQPAMVDINLDRGFVTVRYLKLVEPFAAQTHSFCCQ